MKKLRKLLIGLAGLSLSVGAAIGVGLNADKGAKEAKADDTTIYCECNQNWWLTGDTAAVGFYAFGGSAGENAPYPGVRMSAVAGKTHVWSIDIDLSNYANCIFTRVPATGNVSDWGAKTNDLVLSPNKNYCIITSTTAQWTDNDQTAACEWTEYNDAIANGVYLRGKVQGSDYWNRNFSKFSGTAAKNDKASLKVELRKDDEVKAVKFDGGVLTEWLDFNTGAGDTEKDKGTAEFPVTVNASRSADVSKTAIYNISVEFNNTSNDKNYYDYYFEDEATSWANDFLGSMTCSKDGDPVVWKSRDGVNYWSWNDFADAEHGARPYADLGDIAKDALHDAVGADTGSSIVQAAKRHDVLAARYGFTRFMSDRSGNLRAALSSNVVNPLVASQTTNGNTAIVAIIAISAISILAIGGYFFIRKRKEDR